MIESLKKNLNRKSILAYLIFGAIIVVFVFFGYEAKQQGNGYAARVNHKIISEAEYQNSLNQIMEFYSKMLGGQMGQSPEMLLNIRNSALEQLIDREVVVQGAEKEGFQITNDQIRDFLLKIPAFQKDGVFQRSYYEAYLQNQRITASRFESQLKSEFVTQQVRKTFTDAFVPFESELQKLKKLKSRSYIFDYVKLGEEQKIVPSDNTDAEIKKLGLKWSSTAPVTMDADSINEIGFSEKLMKSAFKLSKKGEYIPEVIQTAQGHFIIRLGKIEDKNVEPTDILKNQLKSQRANEAFSKWSKNLAKEYTIEKNMALVGMATN